jgi:cytochrome c oxidase subunit III
MPGTIVTDEVELIRVGGGGSSTGGHDDDGPGGGGGDSSSEGAIPQRTYITGMFVALGAILMFFMALVSAYVVRKGIPNSTWVHLRIPQILWLNTCLLLGSSITLARSRQPLLDGDEKEFRRWWGATTILGTLFLFGQIVAWRQLVAEGVYLTTNPSSSFFYVFTAAHGLHLLGGVIALQAVAFRPTYKLTRGTAVEVVSMYWHFMDGLWVFLFLLLLLGQ